MTKLSKVKWFKPLYMALALMFCMSAMSFTAFATEADLEWEMLFEYDEQPIEVEADVVVFAAEDFPPEPDDYIDDTETDTQFGSGFRPFTPPGTGTVVDNASDNDGKEFYTIKTEDGSVFYLIIDRQRNVENVYFKTTLLP